MRSSSLLVGVVFLPSGSAATGSAFRIKASFVRAVAPSIIEVRLPSGRHTQVRLIGVRRTRACECDPALSVVGGKADASFFVSPGVAVILTGDRRRARLDSQSRLQAYVQVPARNLTDLGNELLANGYVRVTSERFARRRAYLNAERYARERRQGTWRCPEIEAADLAITVEDDPDPVRLGEPLTFTAAIQNLGPSTASAVSLAASVAPMRTFALGWGGPEDVGAAPASCTVEDRPAIFQPVSSELVCRAQWIESMRRWVVTVTGNVLGGRYLGSVYSHFQVRSCSPDPVPANNAVTVETSELPPAGTRGAP